MRIAIKISVLQDIRLERMLCNFCLSTINSFRVIHEKQSGNGDATNNMKNGPTFSHLIFLSANISLKRGRIYMKNTFYCVPRHWLSAKRISGFRQLFSVSA